MEVEDNTNLTGRGGVDAREQREALIRHLHTLSGKQILERILSHDAPLSLVRGFSSEDFFWLVKKVGLEDCVPLLRLASFEQWQYILDLEIWRRDRFDIEEVNGWLTRLAEADIKRLAHRFMGEEEVLSSYFFLRSIQVAIRNEDEAFDLSGDFFTFDGLFYVRVLDKGKRETVERILRAMADEDHDRYQAFLLSLAGALPAELEEELYRQRNVRLAEHGFLPMEEAMAVYAPLGAGDRDLSGEGDFPEKIEPEEGSEALVPVAPFAYVGEDSILKTATSAIDDPELVDRLRLEFAGLCNQILSADGLNIDDLRVLLTTGRMAAGYLNLSLEELSGEDLSLARKIVAGRPLVDLFRVGYGLAIGLKWEVERWLKKSWFSEKGLEKSFWGEWGGTLTGLIQRKPKLFSGGGYKDFEALSEIKRVRGVLEYVEALDSLLRRLEGLYPVDEEILESAEPTFHPFLFNLWGRSLLELEPRIAPISSSEANRLFEKLRRDEKDPPYSMEGWEENFVSYFLHEASDLLEGGAASLEGALSEIWSFFREEYSRVPIEELGPKYSRSLLIRS